MQEKRENQAEQAGLFSFDPVTVVRDVLKRWYLVVAAALLVGMASYVATDLLYTPQYTTYTTFVVSVQDSSNTVYQNLSATTNLAAVFSEVLNSSILRATVLEQLHMTSFDGKISASAVAETNLLTLQVTASDPRTAFLVIRSIIENHPVVSYQVLGDTILEVLQQPVVPTAPSNPRTAASNMKKGAVLAAAAVCALLAVLSYMRDTVRSTREAEKKLGCRALGAIGHERKYKTLRLLLKQKKTSILITSPATSFSFVETFRKLRRRVEQHMPKDGKVLMVTSVMENEGKSTVAVNLALAMAKKGRKVLLVDCDLRGPACYKILEYPWNGAGTVDVAAGKADLAGTAVYAREYDLYLLLQRRGLRNSADVAASEGMERLVSAAREAFDFVVLDTPPLSAAPDAESIMELADASVLVVQQNVVNADVLSSAVATMSTARSKMLGCVVNNVYQSVFSQRAGYGYGYGYGRYGKYGKYGKYGAYGGYGDGKQTDQ